MSTTAATTATAATTTTTATTDAPTATTDATAVVDAYFAAFGARDIDRALSLVAPDAVWTVPGDPRIVPWVGVRQGHDALRDFFTELFTASEPLAFEVHGMTEVPAGPPGHGTKVVIPGRFAYRFTASRQILDDTFVMVFTIADGRIAAYDIFEDSLGLARAYTGDPALGLPAAP
ncbi:nuclear transport factor 2 family protein [Streptomyces sp. NRRL S-87]|uniref:nuclear transport factor 2 family protein n=1 Tax=Streptomyces sp. NRRL S-87 TaxID=1463920 RepID=UPI0004BF2192|nr:nuclear transport factor 2 family protein [Streptomyces sp. NRRL S-87]